MLSLSIKSHFFLCVNPQILDSCKLKGFADDNFKFDEIGRKLSKQVENTVGKREIAHYEQFLLFPQCFQTACFPGASKGIIVWEWVKELNVFSFTIKSKLTLEQSLYLIDVKSDMFPNCIINVHLKHDYFGYILQYLISVYFIT